VIQRTLLLEKNIYKTRGMNIFTIGVYGSTEDDFFKNLLKNKIDMFVDIRRRRGVRGSKYAFVNSKRLQAKLAELNISYQHILDLAPTNDIREMQKDEDIRKGILKRERTTMGKVFRLAYQRDILEGFEMEKFIKSMEESMVDNLVLFCVEEHPDACHRSLVAKRLAKSYNLNVQHIYERKSISSF